MRGEGTQALDSTVGVFCYRGPAPSGEGTQGLSQSVGNNVGPLFPPPTAPSGISVEVVH